MAKITLGGRDFDVSAFTFDQLQAIGDQVAAMTRGTAVGMLAKRQLILYALDGQISDLDLGQLKVTFVEVDDAVTAILTVSGLIELGERYRRSAPA